MAVRYEDHFIGKIVRVKVDSGANPLPPLDAIGSERETLAQVYVPPFAANGNAIEDGSTLGYLRTSVGVPQPAGHLLAIYDDAGNVVYHRKDDPR